MDGIKMEACVSDLSVEIQTALNHQLHSELCAFYAYVTLETFFKGHILGLDGFARFYKTQSLEELRHAEVIRDILTVRNGSICFQSLIPPHPHNWASISDAVNAAFYLEEATCRSLIELVNLAQAKNDFHVSSTLTTEIMGEQMKCLQDSRSLAGRLKTCTNPSCLYQIDTLLKKTAEEADRKSVV